MEKVWYGNNFKLGVLGGGQLGRMLIQSAINYDVHIYCMDASRNSPCGKLAYEFTEGDIKNYDDVVAFGKDKDVVTVEIEHINVDALDYLESKGVKVFPQPSVLRMIQDKGLQKQFYEKNKIPTAAYRLIDNKNELNQHTDFLPFFQKMRKGGYDGKGVLKIKSENDFVSGFEVPSVLEKFVDFEKELSIIAARNENGDVKTFPLVECEFNPKLNLVEFLFAPAAVSTAIEIEAKKIAENIIEKLDMVGLLAVELFLTKEGKLLVNEIAPRTHNSGHHTIECNQTSQFEQHLRAITGQPLGSTSIVRPGVMINLLGEEGKTGETVYKNMSEVIKNEGVYVHVYGKPITKPNRKMGHITITNSDIDKAKSLARKVKDSFKVTTNN